MRNSFVWIGITSKSPIHIGYPKPNFSFLPTQNYIPGSIIRGALAEYLIAQGKKSQIKAFVENMRFGNFFPSKSSMLLSLPLPYTAFGCKKRMGFKTEKEKHGIFDSLLALIAYEELKRQGAKFIAPFVFKCQGCEDRVDKVDGFYVKEQNYEKVDVKKTSQTKVAISRWRRAAEGGMLYSVTAINHADFVGRIWGNDDKINKVIEAINTMGIGAFTTRGYGKVEAEKKNNLEMDDLKTRVEAFNKKLKEVWEGLLSIACGNANLSNKPKEIFFSVDLLSPSILKNFGVPTLKLRLKLSKKTLEPVVFSAYPTFVGGWSTAWGLPKETDLGVGIGSSYVFKVEAENENLYEELEKLETEGIGERTKEGYGEVLICHPFHKEVEQV